MQWRVDIILRSNHYLIQLSSRTLCDNQLPTLWHIITTASQVTPSKDIILRSNSNVMKSDQYGGELTSHLNRFDFSYYVFERNVRINCLQWEACVCFTLYTYYMSALSVYTYTLLFTTSGYLTFWKIRIQKAAMTLTPLPTNFLRYIYILTHSNVVNSEDMSWEVIKGMFEPEPPSLPYLILHNLHCYMYFSYYVFHFS